jgi:hypothetical protein
MPQVEWNYEKPLLEGIDSNIKYVVSQTTDELFGTSEDEEEEDASLSSVMGNGNETKKFTTDFVKMLKKIKKFIEAMIDIFMNILNNRGQYDVIEWSAVKVGNVVSGNISTKNELVNTFSEAGTKIDDFFTKTQLDALQIESKNFTPEGELAYNLSYDYLLFPFMIWVVYNWYYKLFFSLAECPVMQNYEPYCQMVYPGIVTGHVVLPLYEFNRSLFWANSIFKIETKSNYPLVFFIGSFLAVYFLWVQGVAQFDAGVMETIIGFISFINVCILFFKYYLDRHPVNGLATGILALIVFIFTMSIAYGWMKNVIYIVFMALFIYFSFFVLIDELKTWDVLHIMEKINETNQFPISEQDSLVSPTTWIKLANNYVFTSPMLLLFCFITLSHISDIALLPQTQLTGVLQTAMVLSFIVAALYSVLAFKNKYFGAESILAKKLSLFVPPGTKGDPAVMAQINATPDPQNWLLKQLQQMAIPLAIIGGMLLIILPVMKVKGMLGPKEDKGTKAKSADVSSEKKDS